MDTQAIRKKILDLALRGKLTEQLPEDGTGEDLYQQIQHEKIKLEKAGIVKKTKPLLPVSKHEMPYSIPDNWKWKRIGEVGTTITGGTPAKDHPEYYGGEFPFFKPSDLDAGRHISIATEYLTEQGKKESRLISKGSILVCCIGSIGKSAIIDIDGTANQQINAIIPILCDSDYVQFAIEDNTFQQQLNQGSRATTVSIINKSKFDNCIIPFPPLAEQKRIANKIKSVFAILDTVATLQSQYQDNLATLKSKIIDAGIQGKLTEQLPEDGTAEDLYQQIHTNQGIEKKALADINADLPEIPFTWRRVHLGDIVRILGGKRIPAGRKLTTENTGHKYIRISDMKNRSVDAENLLYVPEDIYPSISQYIIRKEDVYITVAGTIGRVGKIPESVDGANLTENADRLVFSNLDQNWLIYCLSSTFVQKQIEYLTTQVAQPKLAIKRIQEFLVPLPPLAEQKRIVAKLEELLPLCEKGQS